MNVDDVYPIPVLSFEERIRYIEKQRIAIRSLIEEFGLERVFHYTIYDRPFGFVYECALKDLLVLDLVIYEIIYERERRELYLFYARVKETGTMISVRAERDDMEEGPTSDDDDNEDDDDNNDVNDNVSKMKTSNKEECIG
jgi:hypothetical protein